MKTTVLAGRAVVALLALAQVQVKGQKTVYLEQAKYVKDQAFISGYEIDKHGEPVLDRGRSNT